MIDYIRIQNFKSIEDATFHLQDVNLLVGANNSGKTNFLKALQFLSDLYNQKPIDDSILKNFKDFDGKNEMSFTICSENSFYVLKLRYNSSKLDFIECFGIAKDSLYNCTFKNIGQITQIASSFSYNYYLENSNNITIDKSFKKFEILANMIPKSIRLYFEFDVNIDGYIDNIKTSDFTLPFGFVLKPLSSKIKFVSENLKFLQVFSSLKIYKPNLTSIKSNSKLTDFEIIDEDSSNLVSFLDEMANTHFDIYENINKQLSECVQEFVKVTTPNYKLDGRVEGKKLNFISNEGTNFSADDVSDGVLYFLSLLCIINQPNAPKLLLLEEPENGIHPVRIQEIINYIFKLTQDKNIQIVFTSHSPVVIDLFTDYPESIFIFNIQGNSSVVKNLKTDIITEYKEKFGDEVDVMSNLSANWFAGLIGGVPA